MYHMKKRRKITVSSLCPPQQFEIKAEVNQEAVERMIGFWLKKFDEVLPDKPDLIVVPEACDRYPLHTREERIRYYQLRGNQVKNAFAKVARENRCYIVYSAYVFLPDGTARNTSILLDRHGEVAGCYNKNHIVIEENAEYGVLCGKEAPVFETDFGRVGMAICFDLNFHELLEKYAVQQPDLMIFSSMYHGSIMQNYWAYRCRSYFIGAVAGVSGNLINPLGVEVACSTNYFSRITASMNLDFQVVHLDYNWEKLEKVKRKYGRRVSVFEPGKLGSVLLTSEMEDISSSEIIREFEIETWDKYYKRALAFHHQNNA